MGYLRQHADEASPAADAEDGVVVLRRQGAEDEGQPHEHPPRRSRADSVQRCAKPQLLLLLSTKPGNFESNTRLLNFGKKTFEPSSRLFESIPNRD